MAEHPASETVTAGATEQLSRLISLVGTVIAPASLITALLFYFGYVSARAQFDYFGLDVDLVGLTTQDYVMRSPQPLLTPLLVLLLLAAAVVTARRALAAVLGRSPAATSRVRAALLLLSGAAIASALVLVGAYAVVAAWPAYALVTPTLLAIGAALGAYALGLGPTPGRRRSPVRLLLAAVVVVSVFWATATVAGWSGRGLAKEQARDLGRLPSVVVDSREQLFLPASAGVSEHALPLTAGAEGFRFRYANLRLLVQGPDRMFLVPGTWTPAATTVVVPLDGRVRVQFQFRNDPP